MEVRTNKFKKTNQCLKSKNLKKKSLIKIVIQTLCDAQR
jgi:hypothetical protein